MKKLKGFLLWNVFVKQVCKMATDYLLNNSEVAVENREKSVLPETSSGMSNRAASTISRKLVMEIKQWSISRHLVYITMASRIFRILWRHHSSKRDCSRSPHIYFEADEESKGILI